MMRKYIPK